MKTKNVLNKNRNLDNLNVVFFGARLSKDFLCILSARLNIEGSAACLGRTVWLSTSKLTLRFLPNREEMVATLKCVQIVHDSVNLVFSMIKIEITVISHLFQSSV